MMRREKVNRDHAADIEQERRATDLITEEGEIRDS